MFTCLFRIFCLLASLASLEGADWSSQISSVEVKIGDCDDCGMTTGLVSLMICGKGPVPCCLAHSLDHLLQDDFNSGDTNVFTGETLGQCYNFLMGEGFDLTQVMTLYHTGLDDAQFDEITVKLTTGEKVICTFGNTMDKSLNSYWVTGQACRIGY